MKTPRSNSIFVLLAAFIATPALAQAEDSSSATTAPAAAPIAAPTNGSSRIDCVEIELFSVAEEKIEGQTDRAANIPARNLEIIRDRMLTHLPREARGVTAVAAGAGNCPNQETAATLRGEILDFRKGNMALRYFVGFGAGSQKVRVKLTLSRKSDGAQIVQTEVADTKWAGAFGGTNTKGLDDFAEKAAEAAATGLR